MCIYNTALKLARFIHMLRKKAGNSQQKGNILEFWDAALRQLQGITTKFRLYNPGKNF